MRKSEIVVGGHYTARVSGKFVTVRVDAIRVEYGSQFRGTREVSIYDVTNLTTKRRITFRSAAKFRSPVKGPTPASVRHNGDEESDPLAPEICSDPTSVLSAADCQETAPVSTPNLTCPRCGAPVTVENGRYSYHKHATKGITCGMAGEKVELGVKYNFAEGEQGSDPTDLPKTNSTPSMALAEVDGCRPDHMIESNHARSNHVR